MLAAQGLTSGESLARMDEAFAGEERVLLAAHPEHHVMGTDEIGARVVENLGPHVASFYMDGWGTDALDRAEDADELLPEAEFPRKMPSNLFLADGTVVGRALIRFGDTTDGLTAHLAVRFPVTCPGEILDHHLRHYAVEFRNWIVATATARAWDPGRTPGPPRPSPEHPGREDGRPAGRGGAGRRVRRRRRPPAHRPPRPVLLHLRLTAGAERGRSSRVLLGRPPRRDRAGVHVRRRGRLRRWGGSG
ncbi:hypothetical protein ACFUJU_11995 [Streptomyces sp. NPDC057235]|uniref:hypothetical protein n=1 Tax=Streptomyces sp. NPDC057235 TaxID=3346058 RepID=UPI003629DDB0